MDHWTNYKERFSWYKRNMIPDEIVVGDLYAKQIANKVFEKVKITYIKNPYWNYLKSLEQPNL